MTNPFDRFDAKPKANPFDRYDKAEREGGMILPMSWDKGTEGNVRLDWQAGIPGALIRAFTAPGDVMSGKVNAFGPEGEERAREMALFMLPSNAAMRAGERALPGVSMNTQKATPKVPTAKELKAEAKTGYKAVRETGAEYPGSSVGGLADDVQRALETEGLIAELSPNTYTVLSKLRNPPEGSVVTVTSLDAARKTLNRIAGNYNNPHDQEAARRVIERIDDFIQAGGEARPVAGAPAAPAGGAEDLPRLAGPAGVSPQQEAARLIKDARGNAAARFRSDRVTGIEDAAELRAAAANSGQNLGNTLRQRLAGLALDQKKMRGFSPQEREAIEQVIRGTASMNTLRYVGNLLGGGGGIGQAGISAMGAGFGAATGGVPGAIAGGALPLIGAGSRAGHNALTSRAIKGADELVRKRSPLYQQRESAAPMTPIDPFQYEMLLRSLMLQQSGQQ
jgi:hypothetical protein